MFTQQENIHALLLKIGYESPENLEYINKGVMTDKYSFRWHAEEYIIRCYPPNRSWLAKIEYQYLEKFQNNQILAPKPEKFQVDGQAALIYKKLPGKTLGEVYDKLDDVHKDCLCQDIVENYKKISAITTSNYGDLKDDGNFSYNSWKDFLLDSINTALRIFESQGNEAKVVCCKGLRNYVETISLAEGKLVWSDFSVDNIIVNEQNQLSGFIDFEGLISGDPLLGLGYLIAHGKNNDFVRRIFQKYGVDNERHKIDFYSVLRYCRLLPYVNNNLPNGESRTPIEEFLPYSCSHLLEFSRKKHKCCSWLKSLRTWMLLLTVSFTLVPIGIIPTLYKEVLKYSQIEVKASFPNIPKSSETPVWFSYNDTVLATNRVLSNEDVTLLRSLVSDTTEVYPQYLTALNKLAFISNTSSSNVWQLLLLTLCFVLLGCSGRTMYDFIGWMCYKKGQDMNTWWPWYLFRPFIGVPIAALLLVAVRTSFFSGLFTSKDLNTYLVVSFLAGYSMMEFLTMLRRISKTLFGANS